jgi:hypothetical protein
MKVVQVRAGDLDSKSPKEVQMYETSREILEVYI